MALFSLNIFYTVSLHPYSFAILMMTLNMAPYSKRPIVPAVLTGTVLHPYKLFTLIVSVDCCDHRKFKYLTGLLFKTKNQNCQVLPKGTKDVMQTSSPFFSVPRASLPSLLWRTEIWKMRLLNCRLRVCGLFLPPWVDGRIRKVPLLTIN